MENTLDKFSAHGPDLNMSVSTINGNKAKISKLLLVLISPNCSF